MILSLFTLFRAFFGMGRLRLQVREVLWDNLLSPLGLGCLPLIKSRPENRARRAIKKGCGGLEVGGGGRGVYKPAAITHTLLRLAATIMILRSAATET